MISPRHNLKVSRTIVSLVAITVMDNFIRTQASAYREFRNYLMLTATTIGPMLHAGQDDVPVSVMSLSCPVMRSIRAYHTNDRTPRSRCYSVALHQVAYRRLVYTYPRSDFRLRQPLSVIKASDLSFLVGSSS